MGKVRINNVGCLDRCESGPVIVIYPNETWYTYVDRQDLTRSSTVTWWRVGLSNA